MANKESETDSNVNQTHNKIFSIEFPVYLIDGMWVANIAVHPTTQFSDYSTA